MARGKVREIQTIEEAEHRILRLEKHIRELRDQVSKVDAPTIARASEEAKTDAEQVHQAMQAMIIKLAVVTELPRFLRKNGVSPNLFLPKLLPLLDREDEWWRARGNFNMELWAKQVAETEAAA